MNILCVCAGNTCRSPMFERLMRKYACERQIAIHVESAGVHPSAKEGRRPSRHTETCMRERGIDINDHRSKHVDDVYDLSRFDYVVVMTPDMRKEVMARGFRGRILVLNVKNPEGTEISEYQRCALELEHAADLITGAL